MVDEKLGVQNALTSLKASRRGIRGIVNICCLENGEADSKNESWVARALSGGLERAHGVRMR